MIVNNSKEQLVQSLQDLMLKGIATVQVCKAVEQYLKYEDNNSAELLAFEGNRLLDCCKEIDQDSFETVQRFCETIKTLTM